MLITNWTFALKELVTLDFETYYADDYTLSLMNTSEYIRDPRFLIHGCGIQCGENEPYWVAGHDEVLYELQHLELDQRPVLAHHMQFDGFILHEYAEIHCGFYLDTLSMARAVVGHHVKHNLDVLVQLFELGRKIDGLENTKNKRILSADESRRLGTYCMNDVRLTNDLFWRMWRYLPEDEARLIDCTMRMFCDPRLRVDTDLVRLALERELSHKGAVLDAADTTVEILRSSDQFAEVLRELGVEPPMKPSPTNPETQIYAFAKTDAGFRELQQHPQEEVRLLAEARLQARSTLNETRADRLLTAGNGYPLPVYLNYAGAHTMRWSGGNKLNLQNLPRKGILRQAIMAPPGHKLVIFDLGQIEARLVALFCGQMDLVAAFAANEDVYIKMAARIYNKPEAEVTSDERFIGKICFTADTLVLTDRGIVPIIHVRATDRVWDGTAWVNHDGVLPQGKKRVLRKAGIGATPDHEIRVGDSKQLWSEVQQSPFRLLLAISSALGLSWKSFVKTEVITLAAVVRAELKAWWIGITFLMENRRAALHALNEKQPRNVGLNMPRHSQMKPTGADYSTVWRARSDGATTNGIQHTRITEGEESAFTRSGAKTVLPSLNMFSLLVGGTIRALKLTVSTLMEITNRAIFGLLRSEKTSATNAASSKCNESSMNYENVYDVVNAGPNHRFTVVTDHGPMIVFNCILGMGFGMGWKKLRMTLRMGFMGKVLNISPEFARRIVSTYRSVNPYVQQTWNRLDALLQQMAVNQALDYEWGPVRFRYRSILLPSGLALKYPGLTADEDVVSYQSRNGKTFIWGGALLENIVQALARCVIGEQMLAITDLGYFVATMTHDEIVTIVPDAEVAQVFPQIEAIMTTPPRWAPSLPLAVEGAYDDRYIK